MIYALLLALISVQGSVKPTQTGTGDLQTPNAVSLANTRIRVLVLNFDPLIPSEGNLPLSKVGRWNDPKSLANAYIADVKEISGGVVQFQIVDWRDVNAFPTKTDGFAYTVSSYMECLRNGGGWHEPDGLDYEKVIRDFNIANRINVGDIQEVWLFGAPYFGYWESAMAGPGSFYINGGVYANVPSKRPFAIMGFNYERGVAEMLHNLCHRTEATMSHFYGGWKVDELTTNWARFAANFHQSGTAAVGTCHYPPNAEKDYDYSNPRFVDSTADDWLNYPNLKGKKMPVNCEAWGGPDYHRNYMKWWFTRLPRAAGWNQDGRLNNWWVYVFAFDRFDKNGQMKKTN